MSAFADRLLGPLRSLIRGATARADYYALYSAVIATDNGDETCDLTPEDSRLPSMQSIPKLYGVPGLKTTLKPGAKVLLCFQNGDPGRPAIVLFGSSVPGKVSAQGDTVNLAGDPASQSVILGDVYRSAEDTFLAALVTALAAVNTYAVAIKPVADPTSAATPALTTALTTTLTSAASVFNGAAATYKSTKVKAS